MEHLGSDANDLKQKVANLRKQCNEYDLLLKQLSMPYMDLPPTMQKDLEKHAQFKRTLGLYDMDLSFLSEFYCTIAEKNIGKKVAILKAKRSNEHIEKELAKTNNDLIKAKSFNASMQNELKRYGNIDRLLRNANQDIECFVQKKNQLGENIKIDLDRILMKLEQLGS